MVKKEIKSQNRLMIFIWTMMFVLIMLLFKDYITAGVVFSTSAIYLIITREK